MKSAVHRARLGAPAGGRLLDLAPAREGRAAVLLGGRRTAGSAAARHPEEPEAARRWSASRPTEVEFPLRALAVRGAWSTVQARGRRGGRFALINPGAAWPNKRWPASTVRRGRRVPQGSPRARAVRACGGRASSRSRRTVVEASGGAARVAPADDDRRSARAVARRGADGLGRHRSAAHRRRRRHADRRDLRPDRSRAQRTVGRRTMWWCRATGRAAVTTSGSAARRRGA